MKTWVGELYAFVMLSDEYDPVEGAPIWKQQSLSAAIVRWGARGWQVASVDDDYATLIRRSGTGWFNALAALITFGLWLIYILYRAVKPIVDSVVLKVDNFGNIRCVRQTFGW